jgi:ethanolamine utilization protein EutN
LKIQFIIVYLCGFKLFLGKVIGNIWATRKYEALKSFKLMIVQPLNAELVKTGDPIIAVDTVGSGPGEIVYYITASEAPVDASIVGIVDTINSEKTNKNKP